MSHAAILSRRQMCGILSNTFEKSPSFSKNLKMGGQKAKKPKQNKKQQINPTNE